MARLPVGLGGLGGVVVGQEPATLTTEWQTVSALLAATGVFVWLWHTAGDNRPVAPGTHVLWQWLHSQTWDGSAETARHTEGENPAWSLPPNLARLKVVITRLCLLAFYLLAVLLIMGP